MQDSIHGRRWVPVTVEDRWRVDDEWWRERPVSRAYFKLVMEDGRQQMVFQDSTSNRWFQQSFSCPFGAPPRTKNAKVEVEQASRL